MSLPKQYIQHLKETSRTQEEIGRFNNGALTYIVKMCRYELLFLTDEGSKEEAEGYAPLVAISVPSARKRKNPALPRDHKNLPFIKKQIRKIINKYYDKSFVQLTPEEVDKYAVKNAAIQAKRIISDYVEQHQPLFLCSVPYRDDKEKRSRLYDIMIRSMGYEKLFDDGCVATYKNKASTEDISHLKAFLSSKHQPKGGHYRPIPFVPDSVNELLTLY